MPGEVGEAHELDELGDARLPVGGADPVQLQRQLDVRRDRAPRQQAGLLERDAVRLVDAGLPRVGVKVAGAGVKIRVLSQSGTGMRIRIQ